MFIDFNVRYADLLYGVLGQMLISNEPTMKQESKSESTLDARVAIHNLEEQSQCNPCFDGEHQKCVDKRCRCICETRKTAPAPRLGEWDIEKAKVRHIPKDKIEWMAGYNVAVRKANRLLDDLLASSTAEAERRGEEKNVQREVFSFLGAHRMSTKEIEEQAVQTERERLSRAIEHEGINLPVGKMNSAAIEAVSFFIRTGKQRFEIK